MPRFIRSKYQQYKQDTQQLSTWLALTAINYGFPLSNFASAPQPVNSAVDSAEEGKTAQQLKNAKKSAKKKAKAKGRGDEGSVPSETALPAETGDHQADKPSSNDQNGNASGSSAQPGES
jgi:hypothetical protein